MLPSPTFSRSPFFRTTALFLIIAATIVRVFYLAFCCPLDLAPDEAHYWDWSRHLDWSYYSKGPLVAWMIRLSCEIFGPGAIALTGNEMLAVRLPAVACGGLLLLGLRRLTLDVYRSEKLACAVVAVTLTVPIVAAGSMLMTIDAPFTCCWVWALVFAYRAVFHGSNWAWSLAGVCVFLGILAKHTMVLWLPSFALFLATTPSIRVHFYQRGFWTLTGVGSLGTLPILLWNASNDFVTLRHTQVHAGLTEDGLITWVGPLHFVGTQAAVLLGCWFLAWARALWRYRPTSDTGAEARFLWWMSVPTFVFFLFFSLKNGGGEANWPLAGYLSGMVLGAGWLATEWHDPRQWYRRFCKSCTFASAGLGLAFIAMLHQPIPLQPIMLRIAGPATESQPTPLRRVDPTSRLRGWRYLAAEVDRVRHELRTRGIDPVLATERWPQAGELGFYCAGHPQVHCVGVVMGDRLSQYDLWRPNPAADPTTFADRTFLLVGTSTEPFARFFEKSEPTRRIEYREQGELIEAWTLTIAHGWRFSGSTLGASQY